MSYFKNRNSQKQSQQSRSQYQTKEEISISERLTYLENAVQKLQHQQDQLAPLLNLTDKADSLAQVEITSKQIAQKYRDIECCIKLYDEQIKEIRNHTQGLANKSKTSLKDEAIKRENETKVLKKHIIEVQNAVKQVDLEHQMDVKNLQVASKEEIIQVVENFDNKLIQMKDDLIAQLSDYNIQQNEKQNNNYQQIQKQWEEYKKYKEYVEQQLAIISGNITPKVSGHISFISDSFLHFQEMLMNDLDETIETTVNKDKNEALKKQKTFHCKIKQELLSFRGDLEKIRGVFEEQFKGQVLEHVQSQPLEKKLNGLNQEVRKKIKDLKENYQKLDSELEEQIEQVEESIAQIEQIRQSSPEDAQEAITQIREQILQCAQTLEDQSIKNQSNLYKLQEQQKLVEDIKTKLTKTQANETFERKTIIQKEATQSFQQGQEIISLKKQLNIKSGEIQNTIQRLNNSFNQILKNVEKQLGIKLVDPKHQAMFFKPSIYGFNEVKHSQRK